jgi:glycosyltransferase involved in cell wall biosynthesis
LRKVVYLTRNGLLEPLGQSQVFAYLRGLSRDYAITLITYEKSEDQADTARMALAREACAAHNIRWLPQEFRPRPKIVAPALSMMRMTWLVWREVRGGRAGLIHARSYTRMAEVLGCGLPVIANKGVGDVADIVRQNKVGVIVDGPDPAQMRAALDELKTLMQDPLDSNIKCNG